MRRLRGGDLNRDEARVPVALDEEQHALLAVLAAGLERSLHIGRRPYRLARDLLDHVAGADAFLGRRAVWLHANDGNTCFAITCRGEVQPERTRLGALLRVRRSRDGAGYPGD